MTRRKRSLEGILKETRGSYRVGGKLSATEASRNFSEILNRTLYRGECFVIERGGKPVCEIRPATPTRFTVADLAKLMKDLPPIDEAYLRTVEELTQSQPSIPASPWEP